MSRHKFTRQEAAKGGRTTAALSGGACPRCPRTFTKHLALAGHLGLHAFADRFTGGNMRKAAQTFNLIGRAATDPFPRNGAFSRAHQAWDEVKEQIQATQ